MQRVTLVVYFSIYKYLFKSDKAMLQEIFIEIKMIRILMDIFSKCRMLKFVNHIPAQRMCGQKSNSIRGDLFTTLDRTSWE